MAKIRKTDKKTIDEKSNEVSFSDQERYIEKPVEVKPELEKKEELLNQENLTEKELRQKIEEMSLDEALKKQVQSQAQQLKYLDDQEKVKQLLKIAETKGVVYAVNVAKKMNDAYILDSLHDLLVEKGFYRKLLR